MCNKPLKLLASLIGVVGASILIGLPVEAQQSSGGATNPRPSIFNEPPYNRRTGTPPTTPTTPPSETQPPETAPSPVTPAPGATEPSTENVVALAAANDSFKTLTAALKAAGLTETLSGQGPFTVFAPTDAAFAQLPQDALQELLKPENKDILVKILTYHVVPGNVTSSDLKSGEVKTVEGGAVNVQADPSKGVSVNDASVVQPDIKASNGVIHAIDKVMLPPDL
ncbi:fasciclin domain-containing protein [Chroococcidiopsis sp. FACHB-1243]|uniref:fasciclin domain-containing protein n=1 Tax=Chroococcidiopsis sp. [FACHB-1243] TaxID=2692781 RepID=UPI0017866498|nr:fasciclin domain-containing protein [Chroococcidiopsis sp. [FACHB-1243]]MBD2304751.1 fasciclin domain-containing protein [Chroococcidiopsis sp. [FACHB-1243]]